MGDRGVVRYVEIGADGAFDEGSIVDLQPLFKLIEGNCHNLCCDGKAGSYEDIRNVIRTPCEQEDPVNHPPHYTQGGVECIDAIRAALTEDEFRGYCKGAALKYVWRERHKGGDESLRKARWYINELLGENER